MHPSNIFALAAFFAGAIATPMPASVNQPITPEEYQALQAGGLKARSPQSSVNQPITPAEWQALQEAGLRKREDAANLDKRDKLMNCGHLVTGKGGSGGNGKWIPVQQFADVADEFCRAYVGTDIAKGHETSDTYPITLTNQDNPSIPGPAGNIVFAIYNTARDPTWAVDHDTCLKAMQAPLTTHSTAPDRELFKRDYCWGTKHNDYEGGYYEISGIGAFGSEVYAA